MWFNLKTKKAYVRAKAVSKFYFYYIGGNNYLIFKNDVPSSEFLSTTTG
jgi:hypothetical protein